MRFLLILTSILLLISCNKNKDQLITVPEEPKHPSMQYIDLLNREVTSHQGQLVDINSDGENDFLFSTHLIGDPIERIDKLRFSAYSSIHSSLFVSGENSSPILNTGDKINGLARTPFEWFVVSEVELAEKIIGFERPPFWSGDWKNVSHKFIAVQINNQGKLFHGWIELSFDTNQDKLILHKAGISKEEGKEVRAGF